jgi:hypothetical protein
MVLGAFAATIVGSYCLLEQCQLFVFNDLVDCLYGSEFLFSVILVATFNHPLFKPLLLKISQFPIELIYIRLSESLESKMLTYLISRSSSLILLSLHILITADL